MADETTPDGKRLAIARRQADRERLLRELRESQGETPPDWDDHEEPSKVTLRLEGEAAEIFAARQGSLYERAKASLAPVSERMSSPKGKVAALVTLVVSAVVAAVANELAKRGVFGP
jgi:hypothetical protein